MNIGPYEILTTLGASAAGVVFHALDPAAERYVAIKVMPREYLTDSGYRRRLENAKVMGALNHPSVVPVLDRGIHEEQPYIVMPYLAGGSLADWLEKEVLTLNEATSIIVRLAPGLDAAHERGIVHCLLKPSNILFDEHRKAHIADFGIAPESEVNLGNTQRPVFGEPTYMSPEQIMGEELDGRSDIYTLGLLLYEMLAGAPPYQADSPIGTALMHLNEPVPDLLAVRPDLPRACQTVIARSLAKDRELRFKMAAEMAVMLSEVNMAHHDQRRPAVRPVAVQKPVVNDTLEDSEETEEPLEARQLLDFSALQKNAVTFLRETLPSFFKRPPAELIRDRRAWIGGGVILALVVLGILALTGVFGGSGRAAPGPTPTMTAATNTPAPTVEPTDVPVAIPTDVPNTPTPTDLPEPAGLTAATAGDLVQAGVLKAHIINTLAVAWSPDGTRLASGGGDLLGLIWDVAAEDIVFTLAEHNDNVTGVAFSPDGSQVVTASNDSMLRIWDAKSGNLLQTLNGHLAGVTDVDWSPDGSRIVSGGLDGQVIVWDADSGEALVSASEHLSSVRSVAFSPDGSQIASGSDDWKIILSDAETLAPAQTLGAHIATVNDLAFSPDGRWLASSSFDRKVLIWALDGSEAPALTLEGHQGDVPGVAYSPDGSVLVSVGLDNQLLVWDAQTGDLLNTLTPGEEAGGLLSVAISPDGASIAAGAKDGSIVLWRQAP